MRAAASLARNQQEPGRTALRRRLLRDQLAWQVIVEVVDEHHTYWLRSNLPREESSGFHRSPSSATRAGTFIIVKASIRMPCSISPHFIRIATVVSGPCRTE